ncbi:MAG TPA: hypothetical protein VIR63_01225 [Pontiella sp.]
MKSCIVCPLYQNSQRLCTNVIPSIPERLETLQFCMGVYYMDCPFFKYVNNPSLYCDYFADCSFCENLAKGNLKVLTNQIERWCLTGFMGCACYKKKKQGLKVPENLHPDGSIHDFDRSITP